MSASYESILVNKIVSDFQNGKKEGAIKELNNFLEKNPEDNIARYNLALMYENIENNTLAIKNYDIVISKDKKNWKARFNLYLIRIREKKFTDALKLINEVLIIKKDYQPALRDKALSLLNLKKPEDAMRFILQSIKIVPKDYIALNTLGLIYLQLNRIEEAEKLFLEIIKDFPSYISTYNNLGRCYSLQFKHEEALKYFKITLNKDPNYLDALNNIANYYNEVGSYKKALEYYYKALNIDKDNNELLFNIGCSYAYLKENKKAEKYYKKSFKLDPSNNKLNKNYAILLLSLQRYQEAWAIYDGRLDLDEFHSKNDTINNLKDKLWKGKTINEKEQVLVVKEQGIGDEILHASMYSDLFKKFPNIKIESDKRLISIFERSFNKTNIFVPYNTYSLKKESLKKFNTIMYAGSLGRLFRNSIKDFPQTKYLESDKKIDLVIKNKLKDLKNFKIGISWISKRERYGKDKSINLNLLKPILKLQKYSFINLQYGDTKDELQDFEKNERIKIHAIQDIDLFNDFESIASLLKNLDLLISVSNSTAHVAAALGVPTWIIKPKNHATFHYWNQPKNTTPWYPSVKLYSYFDGWKKTIEMVKNDLEKKFI